MSGMVTLVLLILQRDVAGTALPFFSENQILAGMQSKLGRSAGLRAGKSAWVMFDAAFMDALMHSVW